MNDNDWFLIEGFIWDINLVKKGLAFNTFMNSINERLKENCDSEETISDDKPGIFSYLVYVSENPLL